MKRHESVIVASENQSGIEIQLHNELVLKFLGINVD
jgi:hypothetical protein